jgi:hypothetical protein
MQVIMENQSTPNEAKDIQQTNSTAANGTPGTTLAEDTAKNKEETTAPEGTGIGGTDISGEDSPSSSQTAKSFDRDQEAIDLGLDDGDLDNDVSHRDSELI